MTARGSTSSSFHYQFTYDVFLNFRGPDTRFGFTGNLYHVLTQKGIRTFFDDEELRKGDEIAPKLLKAIEESRMAIIVFSKNYASSIFCLNELDKIHRCIKQKGRPVWPIFYDVKPSDVRHQTGNYKQALTMHKQKLRADDEKMQRWKLALHEIADISGVPFNPREDYEYHFIEKIVKGISDKINRVPLHIAEYPVGLDSRLLKINPLLQVGLNDNVIMIGICGIGGIGKTTIARAVYNSIADNFEGLCFLQDVKEKSKKHGLEKVQKRMLSKILGVKIKIEDVNEGVTIIKKRLKQKKILLILDDVNQQEQLEKFAGHCDWFGLGSRIIITTTNKQLLVRHGVERKYEMEAFNDKESLELLKWNAFKSNQIDSSYNDVLNHVICYAQGLPPALEVIGAHFRGVDKSAWESTIDAYKRSPNEKIQEKLKVSYDGLTQVEKEIFLDIACFFKGSKLGYVIDMVKNAHDSFDPNSGIEVLVDKCLIKIEDDHIEMNNLIQEMGRDVIHQESSNEPGRRSRLWSHQDIVHVLEENSGTNKVRIIILDDLSECMEVNWDGEAFKNMKGLKILIFESLKFSKAPEYLPNSLKVFKWREYPSSSLPLHFCPKKLVVFDVGYSCFNSVKTLQKMENLTVLNLRDCEYITQIPNLSGLSNVKELCIRLCTNLTEIDDSVGKLANLEILDAMDCAELKNFPQCIRLPSLKELKLSFCSSLKYFPEILGKLEIRHLHLIGTGIEKFPSSICNLTELSNIVIKPINGRLIELSSSILLLPKLHTIEVESCGKLPMEVRSTQCPNTDKLLLRRCNISNDILRIYLISFSNVRQLDLTANAFTILPECIQECRFLWKLTLKDCKLLTEVKGIPPNLKRLNARGCISLSSQSKKLLLSEELLAAVVVNDIRDIVVNAQTYFRVPGTSIPEWLDYCSTGASISFWFRNSFPTLCVCALLEQSMNDFPDAYGTVFLNDESVLVHNLSHGIKGSEEDHVLVYDLKRDYLHDGGVKQVFQEGKWNHAEVRIHSYNFPEAVKESGIYVIKQHFKLVDIRFTPPDQSLDFKASTIGNALLFKASTIDPPREFACVKEKEPILNKKRQLMKDDNFASCSISSSISFRCTKLRRTYSIDLHEDASGQEKNQYKDEDKNLIDLKKVFRNQGDHIEDNNWLSLRPCWETPFDDGSIHRDPPREFAFMKEKKPILEKERPLMKDGHFVSCSISSKCTKLRRTYSIDLNEDASGQEKNQDVDANSIDLNKISCNQDQPREFACVKEKTKRSLIKDGDVASCSISCSISS